MKRFIDIGANLTDQMFQGIYHGSKKHEADLMNVLERAWKNGLDRLIITGTCLEDSKTALELAKTHDKLYSTVGCHPTRCTEFEASGDPDIYLQNLINLTKEGKEKVIATGEFGLDYDRLHFCPKETQKKYFEKQLYSLCDQVHLPLFLHCRNAFDDFISILNANKDVLSAGGVVHSFDGTKEEAEQIVDLGLHIGINGCSLKTEANLEAMSSIPLERIMIETDCPWCEIKPTHAGAKYIQTKYSTVKKEKWKLGEMVKGRNEPSNIIQVLEIISAIRQEDIQTTSETIYQNTLDIFFSKK